MQEKIDNKGREMAVLGKNQKEMLEDKTRVTEVKHVSDGFISRVDIVRKEYLSLRLYC